jgi:hypothetical protein
VHANIQALLVLPEQVLNIKVAVQKEWHIELLEQRWRNEITKAILDAKQRRPRCAAEAHADLLS